MSSGVSDIPVTLPICPTSKKNPILAFLNQIESSILKETKCLLLSIVDIFSVHHTLAHISEMQFISFLVVLKL